MAVVYREVVIEWGGREVRISPSYRVIQQVEQKLSLAALLHRVSRGEPPFSQLADLLAMALQSSGCRAEAEEINASMYAQGAAGDLVSKATEVLLAMLPQQEGEQKGKAQAPGVESRPTSDGPSTTRSQSGT
jgi:hypothetical protein